jgi:hypothetical protein
MKDSTQGCDFCARTFNLKDEVTALARKAYDPFSTVLYGLLAFIGKEIDGHMFTHEMELGRQKERVALNDKTIEVVGRQLVGYTRDCKTHPGYEHEVYNTSALDGANRGCAECLEALVRKARETPVFSAADAAAVGASPKG